MHDTRLLLLACLILGLALATGCCDQPSGNRSPLPKPQPIDGANGGSTNKRSESLSFIPPGTVIGDQVPSGWTDLVFVLRPRLGKGDVDSVSATVRRFVEMFDMVLLAKVGSEKNGNRTSYTLLRVAGGMAATVDGRKVIVTTQDTQGLRLGLIGPTVLRTSEQHLKSMPTVGRTATMLVFDSPEVVLRGQQHRNMVVRQAVLVSPSDGKLTSHVWLLDPQAGGKYTLADNLIQQLQPGLREDRVMNVKRAKFSLGFPTKEAVAAVGLPKGKALKPGDDLKRLAAESRYSEADARRLETALQQLLRGGK
jgi:hypothetical protein